MYLIHSKAFYICSVASNERKHFEVHEYTKKENGKG